MDAINGLSKEIFSILSTSVFQKILKRDTLVIGEITAVISLLLRTNIPFDLIYSPGTRREATAAKLIIYINPTTTISFVIAFEGGGSFLGGPPS